MEIYRVIKKSTGSLQPCSTFWNREILYCGTDREEARIVFHTNEPLDKGGSYGNPATETVCEVIEDAETNDFSEDEVSIMDV